MTETMTAPATDGTRDIDAAARDLAARMPASLGVLATIAYNYRWSWGSATARATSCSAWTRAATSTSTGSRSILSEFQRHLSTTPTAIHSRFAFRCAVAM